jgi:PAS domain S-box-containing protein
MKSENSEEKIQCEERFSQLKIAEERLELALEAADMGIYERDLKTNKMTRSKTHLRLFGFDHTTQGLDEYSLLNTVHPEDRERIELAMKESVQTRHDIEVPFRINFPNNEIRWIFFKGRAVYNENGEPQRIYGVSQDITKFRSAEDQLKNQKAEINKAKESLFEANKRLEEYSSVVAHDLKAPLQSILLNAQFLKRSKTSDSETERKNIDSIVSASLRMGKLIDDLLAQAKYDIKRSDYMEIDSNSIINNVTLNLGAVIEDVHAKVFVNNYLPVVRANPTEFGQLFQNIISNSLKYRSDKEPEVEVCAREIKHYWLFTIRDNGVGIDPKDKFRIFDSFERLTETKKIEGSGLGLSICKRIVDRAGGKIWVDSELGNGSTFNVAWPKPSPLSSVPNSHH